MAMERETTAGGIASMFHVKHHHAKEDIDVVRGEIG